VLGKLYYSGAEGIAPNYKKALRWLSRAAILLDPHAFYYLGLMYQEGMCVRPNYIEAYKLFDLSMRLSPFFGEDRKTALIARDRARERLTPREVADANLASKRLLVALLEHNQQGADNLLPQETLAALRDNKQ
jgi:TPR repeat protein